MKLKIDVKDQDDDGYEYVDHVEYQYDTHDLRRELDAPTRGITLEGTRTKYISCLDTRIFFLFFFYLHTF